MAANMKTLSILLLAIMALRKVSCNSLPLDTKLEQKIPENYTEPLVNKGIQEDSQRSGSNSEYTNVLSRVKRQYYPYDPYYRPLPVPVPIILGIGGGFAGYGRGFGGRGFGGFGGRGFGGFGGRGFGFGGRGLGFGGRGLGFGGRGFGGGGFGAFGGRGFGGFGGRGRG